jgi:hypothetical protein
MTQPVGSSLRYRRAADVVSRNIGEETVLLDLRSGRYFGLNASGSAIWEGLGTAGASFDQVFERVSAQYDVGRDVLEADLRTILAFLESEGLVLREAIG